MTLQRVSRKVELSCVCGASIPMIEGQLAADCPECGQEWIVTTDSKDCFQTVEPEAPKWEGGAFECEVIKSPSWAGQFYCNVHGVGFRGEEGEPPAICPVGAAFADGYDEAVLEAEEKWGDEGAEWANKDSNFEERCEHGVYRSGCDICTNLED